MFQKIKIRTFKKKSGILIPLEFKKSFPIKVKRFFYIYGSKNYIRADHAHKKCSQLFVPIFGKIELKYINKLEKGKVILDHKNNEAILLKPNNWCTIKFITNNTILMVICDRYYEVNDYIDNYKKFLKSIK